MERNPKGQKWQTKKSEKQQRMEILAKGVVLSHSEEEHCPPGDPCGVVYNVIQSWSEGCGLLLS